LYTISDSVQAGQAAPTGQRPDRLSYFIRIVYSCNCLSEAIPEFNTMRPLVMCSLPGLAMLGLLAMSSPAHTGMGSWDTLHTAGMLAYHQRDFGMAKMMFHRALDALAEDPAQAGRGEPSPRAATTLNNLAATHEAMGEYAQAELRYRHALTMIEAIQGADHPDVAVGLHNLASLFFSQRAFARAEPLWRRSLSINERALGSHHPHLVQPLVAMGMVTQAQHKFALAETYYVRAIRIVEQAMGADHPNLIPLYTRYAVLLRQDRRADEAEAVEQRIEGIRVHPETSQHSGHDEPAEGPGSVPVPAAEGLTGALPGGLPGGLSAP